MRRSVSLWPSFLAFMSIAGPALAHEDENCMAPLPITASFVREAGTFGYSGFAGSPSTPAFVIGGLSPLHGAPEVNADGSVIFLRGADGAWRAALPTPGDTIIRVYARPDDGAAIIVTTIQTEGPGYYWTLVRLREGFSSASCAVVEFPETLERGSEFLELMDLDITANGRGEIIGHANTQEHGVLWYRYTTRDGGTTWSAPRRLRRGRDARAGGYELIAESDAPEALMSELERFAASR